MLAFTATVSAQDVPTETTEPPNTPNVDDGVPEADEIGRAEFLRGRRAYDSGDYETALDAFERALELTSRPALYYNVGLALDRLRRDAEALRAYEQYLELVAESDERATVEARVLALRRAVDEERERTSVAAAAAEAERERLLREERERVLGQTAAKRRRTGIIVGVAGAVVETGVDVTTTAVGTTVDVVTYPVR